MSSTTFTPAKITFDIAGFKHDVQKYVKEAMDEFEREFIEEMQSEIDLTDTKGYFKQVVKAELHHISTEIVDDVITYVTGFDEATADEFDTIKAKVIVNGMEAGYAGPEGRIVIDNFIDSRHPSYVKSSEGIKLPDSWDHEGRAFVLNAVENLRSRYNDMLESIGASIPADLIVKHIHAA